MQTVTKATTMAKPIGPVNGDDYAATAMRLIQACRRLRDVHPDMTLLQASFLFVIAANPGISQRKAYQILDTNDSNAARTIAILSDIGGRTVPALDLVRMEVNPNDRRERLLHLTPKGKRLMTDIMAEVEGKGRRN